MSGVTLPFEDHREWIQEDSSHELAVEDEDVAVHAAIERGLGQQDHTGVDALDQDREQIRILQTHFLCVVDSISPWSLSSQTTRLEPRVS